MGYVFAFIIGGWFGIFVMALMTVSKNETNREERQEKDG